MKTQAHNQAKQEIQSSIAKNRMHASAKTKYEANETKAEKQANRQRWENQKRIEEQKAQNIKMMIKYQQSEAQQKRQMDFIERQNRTRSQIESKLQKESYEQ